MSTLLLENALQTATRLAQEAGALCLDLQKNLGQVSYKTPKDVVTAADMASDHHLSAGLKAAFPGHALRTEELGVQASDSEYLWICDPVDGTVNFSRGMPIWGVSVALHHRGEPLLAVCVLPALGETFTAIRGRGTFLNGVRVQVSDVDDLHHAVVSNGDFNVGEVAKINAQNTRNFAREADHCQRVKCFGSAVIEGCFVACGRLDAFAMTMSYPWDTAGIALLVAEAGGKSTALDGQPLRFVDAEQTLFSNGKIHDGLVETLRMKN